MTGEFRVVFDTNVVISAILKCQSIPRQALDLALKSGIVLFSNETLSELQEKLLQTRFDRYVSRVIRVDFLRIFTSLTTQVTVTSIVTDCRDPRDNKFLELAIDGQANYLVTGDQDLHVLNPFQSIEVLSPKQFLQRLHR